MSSAIRGNPLPDNVTSERASRSNAAAAREHEAPVVFYVKMFATREPPGNEKTVKLQERRQCHIGSSPFGGSPTDPADAERTTAAA